MVPVPEPGFVTGRSASTDPLDPFQVWEFRVGWNLILNDIRIDDDRYG